MPQLHTLEIYFLLFMVYSFLGWIMEVIVKSRQFHRFVNRGFLIGPYCPIYGFGGTFITLLLSKYADDPLVLFLLAMILSALLEYVTSYVMEKLFHARWWDYSNSTFNLNGRICLNTMIPFGVLGMIIIYLVNPFFIKIFESINDISLNILSFGLFAVYCLDEIISCGILSNISAENRKAEKEDNTEEMSAKVKEAIMSRGWAYRRILNAYPNVRRIRVIITRNVNKAKNKVEEQQEKIKYKTEEQIAKLKLEYDYRVNCIKQKADEQLKRFTK